MNGVHKGEIDLAFSDQVVGVRLSEDELSASTTSE